MFESAKKYHVIKKKYYYYNRLPNRSSTWVIEASMRSSENGGFISNDPVTGLKSKKDPVDPK